MALDYVYIRAWGMSLHSNPDWVEQQVRKAKADKAPSNATFYCPQDKRWHTVVDIKSPIVVQQVDALVRKLGRQSAR